MTWMDEIINTYNVYFKDTFEILGLYEYEKRDGNGMGALVKYKNNSFRLQVLNDRGIIETDISPLFGEEQFRGIEMYSSYLALSTMTTAISELEKRKILGTRLDFQARMSFLIDNVDRLKELLNKDNFKGTLKNIDALGQERFNFRFK